MRRKHLLCFLALLLCLSACETEEVLPKNEIEKVESSTTEEEEEGTVSEDS